MAIELKEILINGRWMLILPKHRAERPEFSLCNGGWEVERMAAIREQIRRDDTVYYIGNELGDLSALICKWGANTILVEPNEMSWVSSKIIWDANNLPYPIACFQGFAANVNDLKGNGIVYDDFPPCANGELIEAHGFCELDKQADVIPQIKIDELFFNVSKHFKHIPNHLCIDCEGSEFEILKGAENVLRSFHPTIFLSLHPEFLFNYYGVYSNDVRQWVKKLGYHERILAYSHELHLIYTKA